MSEKETHTYTHYTEEAAKAYTHTHTHRGGGWVKDIYTHTQREPKRRGRGSPKQQSHIHTHRGSTYCKRWGGTHTHTRTEVAQREIMVVEVS